MQICYIMSCKASAPRGSNGEVPKDGKPPDERSAVTQRPFHFESMEQTIRQFGAPDKFHTENYKDEFRDSSLELLKRGTSSSTFMTRSAKLVKDEFPGSPSFRYYVEEDSQRDSNEGSELENTLSIPIHEQTKGMLDNPHQLIDISKPLHASQEAQSLSNKKKKGWQFKFQTRKNKNSRDTEPPQQEVPVTMPQFSPETVAATLHKETHSFSLQKVYQNINDTAILENSGVVVDSDDLTVKNIKFSEIQQNWVRETGNSMEEAPSDPTYVATLRENDKIMENIDWDSDEEDMSDIVIECNKSAVQNTNLLKTEENKIAKAVSFIEESVVDGLEIEGAREEAKEKFNLDLNEVHKSLDEMMMFDKLNNQDTNFDQKDGVSSTEDTKIECMALTETRPGMKELGKTSNADQELTEKEVSSSNPDLETIDVEYDRIKHPNMLNIVGKLTCHEEFGDQAQLLSQVETYYNQTEENETSQLKKEVENLAADNKELKTQMAALYAQHSQLVNWLQGIGMGVERMESDEMSMQSFESRSDSFSSKS